MILFPFKTVRTVDGNAEQYATYFNICPYWDPSEKFSTIYWNDIQFYAFFLSYWSIELNLDWKIQQITNAHKKGPCKPDLIADIKISSLSCLVRPLNGIFPKNLCLILFLFNNAFCKRWCPVLLLQVLFLRTVTFHFSPFFSSSYVYFQMSIKKILPGCPLWP